MKTTSLKSDCDCGIVHNGKSNPLRRDPQRLGILRKAFEKDMRKRLRNLKRAIKTIVVDRDVFHLNSDVAGNPFTANAPFYFDSYGLPSGSELDNILNGGDPDYIADTRELYAQQDPSDQLIAYQDWFQEQVDGGLLWVSGDGKGWTNKYIESTYKKALIRSYNDVHGTGGKSGPFEQGSRAEFLSSAFGSGVGQKQLQLLGTRCFQQLKGVTAAMEQQMSRILADGLAHGLGSKEIARNLNKVVTDLGKKRAEVLARTEMAHSYSEGQLDGYEQSNVRGVGVMAEWSTVGDDRVCDACAPLEGIVLEIREARMIIPRHPNCRCAFMPAGVGEDWKTAPQQRDTKVSIEAALDKSINAQRRKGETLEEAKTRLSWSGVNKKIAQDRMRTTGTLYRSGYVEEDEEGNLPAPPRRHKEPTKEPTEDYQGNHKPPNRSQLEDGTTAPMSQMDLLYPDDIYSKDGARFYGDGSDNDNQVHQMILDARNDPDKMITVYRGFPSDIEGEINAGDWVTPVRQYAEDHSLSIGDDDTINVVEMKVRAGDLFTEGNSLYEFGWDPKTIPRDIPEDLPAPRTELDEESYRDPQTLRGLLKNLIENEGFSYDVKEDDAVQGGFMVSPYPELELIAFENITPEDMEDEDLKAKITEAMEKFVEKNADIIRNDPEAHFGAWWDQGTQRIYLDVVVRVETAEEAHALSVIYKQESYFDLNQFIEVKVGAREEDEKSSETDDIPSAKKGDEQADDTGVDAADVRRAAGTERRKAAEERRQAEEEKGMKGVGEVDEEEEELLEIEDELAEETDEEREARILKDLEDLEEEIREDLESPSAADFTYDDDDDGIVLQAHRKRAAQKKADELESELSKLELIMDNTSITVDSTDADMAEFLALRKSAKDKTQELNDLYGEIAALKTDTEKQAELDKIVEQIKKRKEESAKKKEIADRKKDFWQKREDEKKLPEDMTPTSEPPENMSVGDINPDEDEFVRRVWGAIGDEGILSAEHAQWVGSMIHDQVILENPQLQELQDEFKWGDARQKKSVKEANKIEKQARDWLRKNDTPEQQKLRLYEDSLLNHPRHFRRDDIPDTSDPDGFRRETFEERDIRVRKDIAEEFKGIELKVNPFEDAAAKLEEQIQQDNVFILKNTGAYDREYGKHVMEMIPRIRETGIALGGESAGDLGFDLVPLAMGETEIPKDHIRFFHYTNADKDDILGDGILMEYAKGESYGEPSQIWAKHGVPPDSNTGKKYVEFSLHPDDPRIGGTIHAGTDKTQATFTGDILPSDIVAFHEPHDHLTRKILSRPDFIEKIRSGEMDDNIANPKNSLHLAMVDAKKILESVDEPTDDRPFFMDGEEYDRRSAETRKIREALETTGKADDPSLLQNYPVYEPNDKEFDSVVIRSAERISPYLPKDWVDLMESSYVDVTTEHVTRGAFDANRNVRDLRSMITPISEEEPTGWNKNRSNLGNAVPRLKEDKRYKGHEGTMQEFMDREAINDTMKLKISSSGDSKKVIQSYIDEHIEQEVDNLREEVLGEYSRGTSFVKDKIQRELEAKGRLLGVHHDDLPEHEKDEIFRDWAEKNIKMDRVTAHELLHAVQHASGNKLTRLEREFLYSKWKKQEEKEVADDEDKRIKAGATREGWGAFTDGTREGLVSADDGWYKLNDDFTETYAGKMYRVNADGDQVKTIMYRESGLTTTKMDADKWLEISNPDQLESEAYEVMTIGVEDIFFGGYKTSEHKDYRDFTLGILFGF